MDLASSFSHNFLLANIFFHKKQKKKKPKINFPENRIKAETLHLFIFKLKTQN
jgi:hypothetical protein